MSKYQIYLVIGGCNMRLHVVGYGGLFYWCSRLSKRRLEVLYLLTSHAAASGYWSAQP